MFQVRVPGFDYTGAGNSTSKKDAHANAAQDFCAYLVRTGKLQEDQVPSHGTGGVAPGGGIQEKVAIPSFSVHTYSPKNIHEKFEWIMIV